MQDRFVGDVGDFGKYGLLRALTGIHPEAEPRLSLGVVWYFREEVGLGYLTKPSQFANCDSHLFDSLKGFVTQSGRTIEQVEASRLLGDAVFFSDPVPAGAKRHDWFERALRVAKGRQIVFLDPDNGLSSQENSSKHACVSEVQALVQRGQTVVVYQSFGRQRDHTAQVEGWVNDDLRGVPLAGGAVEVLKFTSRPQRAFILLKSPEHRPLIERRVEGLLASPWSKHFTRIQPK